jgi:hypothetical protein
LTDAIPRWDSFRLDNYPVDFEAIKAKGQKQLSQIWFIYQAQLTKIHQAVAHQNPHS